MEQSEHPVVYDPIVHNKTDELTQAVHKFWNVESIGILEPLREQTTEREFLKEVQYDEVGQRYQVSLPWKEDVGMPVSNGYSTCVKRLRQVHARLKSEPDLLKEYDRVIQQQMESGIIEEVPESSGQHNSYYLPHHGVVRNEHLTTKVRVVFDGSAKHGSTDLSINECLEKGPNLVPHLFDVLVKFRGYPNGIVADVEKAFHQIGINPDDRRMLRFLWCDDISKEEPKIVQYQFCRLVFGLTSSPAILSSLIQHHLELKENQSPHIVGMLRDSFYVDDFVGGSWSDDQALEIYEKSSRIMKEGGFTLRKWNSNSKVFQERVSTDEQAMKPPKDESTTIESLGSNPEVLVHEDTTMTTKVSAKLPNPDLNEIGQTDCQPKVSVTQQGKDGLVQILGVSWNVEADEFEFDLTNLANYAKTLPPTKRSVLRLSAKIFDPLGFLAAATIGIKMLFQRLCTNHVVWDDPLTDDSLLTWNRIIQDLSACKPVRLPRCYFSNALTKNPISYELHGFCDASSRAYAAVVYLRTVHHNGEVEVNLVASKTRVAPMKKQSIPRLELLGAVILARLVSSIQGAISSLPRVPEVVLWTDSYTALCWIRNNKAWKTYVQHRVNEIRKLTKTESWRFCPGENNPADLPSRGSSASNLAENKTWWNGPDFLQYPQETWPGEPVHTETNEKAASEELRKPKVRPTITRTLANVSKVDLNIKEVMDIQRYGTKLKLLRVTAQVMRFVNNTRGHKSVSIELTAAELRAAENVWIKSIQASEFEREIQYFSRVTEKEPPLVKQLSLFRDEENVIRCRGRIDQATVSVSAKQPILLPKKHYFTELTIREHHGTVHHNGIKETLNNIREKYWILRGREAVKREVRRCVVCKKLEGKPFRAATTAGLPESRVSEAPPFSNTGIDFAGPLYATTQGKTEKAYVCLWTCASTRAVHLELVPNLSVPTFLQAFRRFAARRGLPTKLLSDNAKTFKSAAKEIQKIKTSTEVQRHLAEKGVSWDFIIEKAPWQGGFWERMVRCVKRCLKKTVGRASLSFEEIRTLLIEIEATLNNRPLTYVYDDEQGVSYPLTPSTLIYGRTIATIPSDKQFEVISTNQALTRRAKYHGRLLNQFIDQWRKEYLLSLRETMKITSGSKEYIKVGDIVVLKSDQSACALWKLAKVEELIPSRDNVVRAARICAINKEKGKPTYLRRPIQHLIPLELNSSSATVDPVPKEPVVQQPAMEQGIRPRRNAAVIGEMLRRNLP